VQNFVGPYQILRFLNKGSQGSVYLGYDSRINRRLAIKVYTLPPARAGRRQLLGEAQLVASMDSPKVVQVHDVIEAQNHLAMVMEYVPGCNLEDVLGQTRLSLASTMTVATDIAVALAAARRKNIVHGDLKAANVLITRSGRAKLADFGIAREQKPGVSITHSPASLSALSPEQLAGEEPTGQSDLFALGVLMYRMLSGEHPFYVADKFDPGKLRKAERIPLRGIVPVDVSLPETLLDLVDQLMALEPSKRPRHTRGLRQVMRGILRGMPVASQGSLAVEAKPFFREESSEDLPVEIPGGFGRDARSRMPPGEGLIPRVQYWLRGLHRSGQVALGITVLSLLTASLWWLAGQRITTIEFQRPEIRLSGTKGMPQGFSRQWLIDEVKLALSDRVGRLRVVGDFGADDVPLVYAVQPVAQKVWTAEQVFKVGIRCQGELCVFTVQRSAHGESNSARGMMFADDYLQNWQEIVHRTVQELER
jgi:eukaryotic-like serine/threonine-protein kinase